MEGLPKVCRRFGKSLDGVRVKNSLKEFEQRVQEIQSKECKEGVREK